MQVEILNEVLVLRSDPLILIHSSLYEVLGLIPPSPPTAAVSGQGVLQFATGQAKPAFPQAPDPVPRGLLHPLLHQHHVCLLADRTGSSIIKIGEDVYHLGAASLI